MRLYNSLIINVCKFLKITLSARIFAAFALLLLREMPMTKVAAVTGETPPRLWRRLFRQVAAAYAEAAFRNVCGGGADELNSRTGHTYLTGFADLLAQRVLLATEGQAKETWPRFLAALEEHQGHRYAITQASVDMSPASAAGSKENCRNAAIVNDKYQVGRRSTPPWTRGAKLRRAAATTPAPNGSSSHAGAGAAPGAPDREGTDAPGGAGPRSALHGQGRSTAAALPRPLSGADGGGGPIAPPGVAPADAVGGAPVFRATAGTDGEGGGDGETPSGEYSSALEMGRNQRVYGGTQLPVPGDQAQGPRLPSPEHLITMLYFIAGKLRLPQF